MRHVVKQGECVLTLAGQHGFFWETIWNHPENQHLKDGQRRETELLPGDEVFVPERVRKDESLATTRTHRFKLRGVPHQLRIRLTEERAAGEYEPRRESWPSTEGVFEDPRPRALPEPSPRAGVPYRLEIDGKVVKSGTTEGECWIEAPLYPHARDGRLILFPDEPQERVLALHFGQLNPITTISGVKQRLTNLGFDAGPANEDENDQLALALYGFQESYEKLTPSGELDADTRAELERAHGC